MHDTELRVLKLKNIRKANCKIETHFIRHIATSVIEV